MRVGQWSSMRQRVTDCIADAVGSVDFHSLRPVLLSVSGSRHWDAVVASENLSSGSDGEAVSDSDSEESSPSGSLIQTVRGPAPRDATIKFWSFDGNEEGRR
jgi:telomerase Cajal body protein 1